MITIDKLDKYISNHIEGRKPPVEYLQKYRARVGADFFKLRISNDDARKVIQNALVFVVDRPNYYFLRVSISFKKRGFKTILLTRWGTEEYQKMFFDHIVLYDKFSDLKLLKNCVNCKFYVQSWIGWNFLPVYVSLITNQNIVCNIHDLSNVLFDDNEKLMMLPGWSKRDIDIDLKCEDYILRKFPLVTSMYNSNAFKTFDSDIQKRFGKNILFFPCHPSPHFFDLETRKFSEPLNLVYMGGIPSDDKPDAVFFGGKMRNVLDDLLAQPFRVTIFNNPQLTTTDNQNEINIKYQHLTKSSYESSRFTFEKGYPPWELKSYAKEFHYGLLVAYSEKVEFSNSHIEYSMPTKLFTYLELGLPVIVIDTYKYCCEFVKTHDIGIIVSQVQMKNLYQIIIDNEERYEIMVSNIIKYISKKNMDTMIDELMYFLFI